MKNARVVDFIICTNLHRQTEQQQFKFTFKVFAQTNTSPLCSLFSSTTKISHCNIFVFFGFKRNSIAKNEFIRQVFGMELKVKYNEWNE